jgi:hypothetical protein
MNKKLIVVSALALELLVPSVASVFAASIEAPVAAEVSPAGDIPDNQVFVPFDSPAGFSLQVPEGWARTDAGNQTVFTDKYNRISLEVRDLSQTLDLALVKAKLVPEIEQSGRAVKIQDILETKLNAGTAIRVIYESNSEPNAVTNKQVRLQDERFFFANGQKLVALDLSAPKGADNVDQWSLISSSFRWK